MTLLRILRLSIQGLEDFLLAEELSADGLCILQKENVQTMRVLILVESL